MLYFMDFNVLMLIIVECIRSRKNAKISNTAKFDIMS